MVFNQLVPHLSDNNLFEIFQSGLRSRHSTATALLRVCNDILLTEDAGECECSIRVLLDLMFDTVDHNMLIGRLERWAEITDIALNWFRSYLSHRCFYMTIAGAFSSATNPLYVVPQCSILGPILFFIFMLHLCNIIRKYTIPLLSL